MKITRRHALHLGVALGSSVATATSYGQARTANPIKVGILHSLTGTMAVSELPVVEVTRMAIDEINRRGGLLEGRLIEPVIADGQSDETIFAAEARRLITEEKVSVIFGCWTSASRKAVKPVMEELEQLLFYPVQYEGLESSPVIIYTGAAPNQQILPAVTWSLANLGNRPYLVGSDYVFPRTANALIKHFLESYSVSWLGEDYIRLGSTEVASIIERIKQVRPSFILNTINGDSNVALMAGLREAGLTSDVLPTMSFSVEEGTLASMDRQLVAGDFAAWNYFQSLDSSANRQFVANFQRRYGNDRVLSDPMEAAYIGVNLWAQAVTRARSLEPIEVIGGLDGQQFNGPGGQIRFDNDSQHIWKTVRIGRIRDDGQFDIRWDAGMPTRPEPYPDFRSRAAWETFLSDLYRGWGNRWSAPPA